MDTPDTPARTPRHDGWTPERRTRFLDCLADKGNVRLACRAVNLSPEAAYRYKRRDPLFARAWAAALVLAHDRDIEILHDHAIDGVPEEVWYRGELKGIRRKHDSRLFLAHFNRLEKAAADKDAQADAARFDELLAVLGGETVPDALRSEDGTIPLGRDAAAEAAGQAAQHAARAKGGKSRDERSAAYERGRAEGAAAWDDWQENACTFVDWLCGRLDESGEDLADEPVSEPPKATPADAARPCESVPGTPSQSSTSVLAGSVAAAQSGSQASAAIANEPACA